MHARTHTHTHTHTHTMNDTVTPEVQKHAYHLVVNIY